MPRDRATYPHDYLHDDRPYAETQSDIGGGLFLGAITLIALMTLIVIGLASDPAAPPRTTRARRPPLWTAGATVVTLQRHCAVQPIGLATSRSTFQSLQRREQ